MIGNLARQVNYERTNNHTLTELPPETGHGVHRQGDIVCFGHYGAETRDIADVTLDVRMFREERGSGEYVYIFEVEDEGETSYYMVNTERASQLESQLETVMNTLLEMNDYTISNDPDLWYLSCPDPYFGNIIGQYDHVLGSRRHPAEVA